MSDVCRTPGVICTHIPRSAACRSLNDWTAKQRRTYWHCEGKQDSVQGNEWREVKPRKPSTALQYRWVPYRRLESRARPLGAAPGTAGLSHAKMQPHGAHRLTSPASTGLEIKGRLPQGNTRKLDRCQCLCFDFVNYSIRCTAPRTMLITTSENRSGVTVITRPTSSLILTTTRFCDVDTLSSMVLPIRKLMKYSYLTLVVKPSGRGFESLSERPGKRNSVEESLAGTRPRPPYHQRCYA